jgi:acetoin utilization deacetylase AcuC-like enzyme
MSRVLRAAVIDLDVHQGDGTAAIFAGDESVLTISVHGENNFPFHKQNSGIDIALPDGTGDREYLERVAEVLPAVAAFEPEIVFYQSGVDGLASDRLGRLALTHEGLEARDQTIFEFVREHALAVVVILGGGYSEPINNTVVAHANTFRRAASALQPFLRRSVSLYEGFLTSWAQFAVLRARPAGVFLRALAGFSFRPRLSAARARNSCCRTRCSSRWRARLRAYAPCPGRSRDRTQGRPRRR